MELPKEFKNRMKSILSDDYDRFIEAFEDESAVRSLRVNCLKTDTDDFQKHCAFDIEPMSFCAEGFLFHREKIGADPLHHAGAYYVQDPGAMCTLLAAEHLMKKGMRIIDLCAAPGGKSSQLLAYGGEGGILVSNEIDRKRCRILRGNLERMGAERCVLTNTDTAALADEFGSFFDFVVCDAPCSGEGMMRKYEAAVREWSVENVLMCAERQREILDNAARLTAPEGYLLYSTCTFSLEENEMAVDAFLERHPDFEIIPASPAVKAVTAEGIDFNSSRKELSQCRRFYPHISPGEGQFMCLMQKRADGEVYSVKKKKNKKEKPALLPLSKEQWAVVERFFKDNTTLCVKAEDFCLVGEDVMLKRDLPVPASCVFSGVCAGNIIKGRFEPHHHLFSALGKSFKRRVYLSASSPEVQAYLSGEVIDTDVRENGWCCVFVEGCPLGGGKIVDLKVKNHYPKGLRLAMQ